MRYKIILIILIALLLRAYHLDTESIWSDEGYSINEAQYSIPEIIDHLKYDMNPPLYTFALKLWGFFFGYSEIAARSLSVLFSLITVYLVYCIGKQVYSKEAGIYASIIVSLATFHIQYAQETRSYALFAMLAAASFLFYFKEPNLKNNLLYIITTTLLLYTHIYSIFLIIAQNIPIKFRKKWIISQVTLLILFLPYLSILIYQATRTLGTNTWITAPTLNDILHLFHLHGGTDFLIILLVALSALAFRDPRKEEWTLLSWWLIPIMIPLVFSYMIDPFLYPRYTLPATLGLYLLAARGLTRLRQPLKIVTLLVIIIISGQAINNFYAAPYKENWRDATAYIDSIAGPEDRVLFYPGWTKNLVYDYYSDKNIKTYMVTYKTRELNESDIERISPMIGEYDKFILVLAHNMDSKELREKIEEEYDNLQKKEFRGIRILIYS
ncbi:MAG: glycosyltransferase family 39 protein [Candidatus Woesearchaeota archaeon]